MLDLKGSKIRLAELVRAELEPYLPGRRFTVCARSWRLLEAFDGLPVRRVASVGSRRQLGTLLDRFAGQRLDGVSIHERLLDDRVVAELRSVAGLVLTWPVNAPAPHASRADGGRRADQRSCGRHRAGCGGPSVSFLGSFVDAVWSVPSRFGELDGRYLLPALGLQLLTLVFRSLAWRGVLVAAYPGRRIPILSVGGAYAAGVP